MISNQILQNTIDGLKGITRVDMCIIDTEGKVLATTFPDADNYINPALAFVESPADSQVIQGCQFFKVFDDHQINMFYWQMVTVMMCIWWEKLPVSRFRIFW